MSTIDIIIPDIGTDEVPIIELLVSEGETVTKEQGLMTLESDKATMEVPSPEDGVVASISVALGDMVTTGSVIGTLTVAEAKQPAPKLPTTEAPAAKVESAAAPQSPSAKQETTVTAPGAHNYDYDIVVIGSGPGGYTAAFRAADLGLKVALVERYETIGGVCLNVGCIPSKALLHAAKVIDESKHASDFGVTFAAPEIDISKLKSWKQKSVVGKLTGGLTALAKQRKVTVIHGFAKFKNDHEVAIVDSENNQSQTISFAHAIISSGSRSIQLPTIPHDDERVWDSTGALELHHIPKRLLIIGAGIIGLEMATVYAALGSQITVVELGSQIIPGADADMVKALHNRLKKNCENIFLNTKVDKVEANDNGLTASFSGEQEGQDTFDNVLVAIGRTPNGLSLAADKAGVDVTERGFINVDKQMRTNVNHIFAIGDVVGQPMLAHKATHEAKVAAEVIAGHKAAFDPMVIPSVAYTDPEIAWVGLTETQAKKDNIAYEKAAFPWAANGRALSMQSDSGITKILFDPVTHRVLGAAMAGSNAGELIAEMVLAIEMGADAEDISLCIHPHPTLSETNAMAAEMFDGTITDLYVPKKRK